MPIVAALMIMFTDHEAVKITSCSKNPNGNVINIIILGVNPHPVSVKQQFTIGGYIEITHDLSNKISADVTLEYAASIFNVQVPCMATGVPDFGAGSCHYKQLCDVLDFLASGDTCPAYFGSLPCRCPFKKGIYKINPYTVDVTNFQQASVWAGYSEFWSDLWSAFILDGTYKAELTIRDDVTHEELACYKIEYVLGDASYNNLTAILALPVYNAMEYMYGRGFTGMKADYNNFADDYMFGFGALP